ncbi:MAG: [protein-PII] uridylyltransferase [Alphaproteobacteria bacterium]|nr:[protein-PII] uridylyltransferase [Alphaproteobacteria bacterium]TAD90599.1 MAG: [protein-PII] uridylyltransferase [Alphaproteobacteria bacterium]
MRFPKDRRVLFDRRAVITRLAAVEGDPQSVERRKAVLEVARAALMRGRAEVRQRFEASGDGQGAAKALCYVHDQLLRVLWDDATGTVYPAANPTLAERFSLAATGGYGRGELAPHSDLDILFLLPYKQTPRGEQVAEHLLYLLWDLGLKVGHATRSVEECLRHAKADITIRTALLECRWIWGEQSLVRELRRRMALEVMAGTAKDFAEAKLAERDARHARMGDSRYVLEPNIKEGKGGLRDLHTLFWIAKYNYRVDDAEQLVATGVLTAAEAQRAAKAEAFLWTLRFHLHYVTNRAEERLTFDVQSELARRAGYTDHAGTRGVERLMKHYFLVAKDVGDLTRIICAHLEAQQQRRAPRLSLRRLWTSWRRDPNGFEIDKERLSITDAKAFLADPVNFIRLFWLAHEHGLDIHPTALRLVADHLKRVDAKLRTDPEANRLFLDILTSRSDPEAILRRMNEAGVFGRFVPDFGRVVAQMQFDMYHVYTVDEHTLFALGILARIEQGELAEELPLATSIMPTLASRRALYVAVLLHDIAKGRGGDHSELGAKVAYKLCPRLGLTREETETVAWLVLHHLAMSSCALKRDLSDPKTIEDFVALVKSPERLKLLLVLTVADIRAVGPKVWNNWKAGLLRQLYWAAEDAMTGALKADEVEERRSHRVAAVLDLLRQDLSDWPEEEFQRHVARGNPSYWLSVDRDTVQRHARLIRRAEMDGAPLEVDNRVERRRGITEVTVYTDDAPGLFARIAGALAVAGATIVDAKIHTLANGKALDTFSIQDADGGAFDRPEKLARLAVMIDQAREGRLRSLDDLRTRQAGPARLRAFKVSPRVLIDNTASATHTVIEVNGRDRPGLLHDVGSALAALNVQISTAKVSTFGEQVVDVFYVKDRFGLKIDKDEAINDIRAQLLLALDPTAPQALAA